MTDSEGEALEDIPFAKATATSNDDATASDQDQRRPSAEHSSKKDDGYDFGMPKSDALAAPSATGPDAEGDAEKGAEEAEVHVGVDVAPYRSLTMAAQPSKRKFDARPDPYDMLHDEPVRTSHPHKKHRGMPKVVETNDEDEEDIVPAKSAKKQRGRPKTVEISDEEEAEEEIVAAKPAQKRKGLPKVAGLSDDDADELAAPTPKTKKPKKSFLVF